MTLPTECGIYGKKGIRARQGKAYPIPVLHWFGVFLTSASIKKRGWGGFVAVWLWVSLTKNCTFFTILMSFPEHFLVISVCLTSPWAAPIFSLVLCKEYFFRQIFRYWWALCIYLSKAEQLEPRYLTTYPVARVLSGIAWEQTPVFVDKHTLKTLK